MPAATFLLFLLGCGGAFAQQSGDRGGGQRGGGGGRAGAGDDAALLTTMRRFCRGLLDGDANATEALGVVPEEAQGRVQALCFALNATCQERRRCAPEGDGAGERRRSAGPEESALCEALDMTRTWATSISSGDGGERADAAEGADDGGCAEIEQVAEGWDELQRSHRGERRDGEREEDEEEPRQQGERQQQEERQQQQQEERCAEDDEARNGTRVAAPARDEDRPAADGDDEEEVAGSRPRDPDRGGAAASGDGLRQQQRTAAASRSPGEELISRCSLAYLQQDQSEHDDGDNGNALFYLGLGFAVVVVLVVGTVGLTCYFSHRRRSNDAEKGIASGNRINDPNWAEVDTA